MEIIKLLGFLVSGISCLISFPLFFSVVNGDGVLEFIEALYLIFIFGFGILGLLFLMEQGK